MDDSMLSLVVSELTQDYYGPSNEPSEKLNSTILECKCSELRKLTAAQLLQVCEASGPLCGNPRLDRWKLDRIDMY